MILGKMLPRINLDMNSAFFMVNGKLGLMIYKEPGKNYLRLETGNCDVHDHRTKRDVFGIPRLLTGHFALHPKGKIINGTMHLDLWNAEVQQILRQLKESSTCEVLSMRMK